MSFLHTYIYSTTTVLLLFLALNELAPAFQLWLIEGVGKAVYITVPNQLAVFALFGRQLTAIRWGDKWLPSRLSVQLRVGVVKVDTRWWWSKHAACPCMQTRVDWLPSLWSASVGSQLSVLRDVPYECEQSVRVFTRERNYIVIILGRGRVCSWAATANITVG